MHSLSVRAENAKGHALPPEIGARHTRPGDHKRIIAVQKDWWDGRDLTALLPMMFLVHFSDSSIILEKDGEMIAFLIGFLSPAQKNEGYIHLLGVHPRYRGMGLGRRLYLRFFDFCRSNGRHIVRACTSPENKSSIGFHQKMGFEIEGGNAEVDGIPVTLDYNRPGDHKVLFKIELQ